jgi:hypothetical protein
MSLRPWWSSRAPIFVVLAIGATVRLLPVLGANFPTGDGGLIYALVEDMRQGGVLLPDTGSYNNLSIPFVYPPLALGSAAAIGDVLGVSTFDLLRFLPVLASLACLATFAMVAQRVLPSTTAAVAATLTYALMPHAFDALIAGGGLTRSIGLVFALLSIATVAKAGSNSSRRAAVAGILIGLAFLSHPQSGIFGTVGCLVLTIRPGARWLGLAVTSLGCALAVIAPWLWILAIRNELDDLVVGAQRLGPFVGLIRLASLDFSGAIFIDLYAVVGTLGIAIAVGTGNWRLPAFLLLVYSVGSGAGEFLGAVPWALLGGFGLAFCISALPAVQDTKRLRSIDLALGTALLFLALTATLGSVAGSSSKLHVVTPDQRSAMRWIATEAPTDARFLVATDVVWGDDEISEWFPSLAERANLGTVQGSEWLGRSAFTHQLSVHFAILGCARATATCMRDVAGEVAAPDAFIFIPRGRLGGAYSPADCCPAMRATLSDAGYRIVYDGRGGTIAAPVNP